MAPVPAQVHPGEPAVPLVQLRDDGPGAVRLTLVQDRAIPQSQFDAVDARLKGAEAAIAQAQVAVDVARKALATFRQRIRQLTRRSGGRNLSEIAERLRAYMPGWKAYFQLAQTPKVFRELDEWIRHRLRAVQLKHWRRGTTMYRELKAMGASDTDAYRIATNSRRWWRNSRFALNRVMPIAYFDRLGVPRLS